MTLPKEKANKIRWLRVRGLSVPEISREVSISKSTALRYTRGVEISPQYRQRWLERRNASRITSERNWAVAKERAEAIVKALNEKEMALIAASLYWAEGAKRDFSFSNTDPEMIRVFLGILRKTFGVEDRDLKITLRLYEDLNKTKCLNFWSKVTKIQLGRKTSINILRGSKKGKLLYGMCRIRVRKGGRLLKEIFSIINRMRELMPS